MVDNSRSVPLTVQDRVGSNRASRQQVLAWLALCLTVGLSVIFYLALSVAVSSDPLLMPLDDTYIHFQYARQLAHGEPMVYNPGDPATSGGTSLIYPALLAVGYLLGFSAWSLAFWAVGIGVLFHLGSAWLVYLLGRTYPYTGSSGAWNHALDSLAANHDGLALVMALAFAVSGPFLWAALSGMETALFVFFILLTLFTFERERFGLTVLAATLVTLIRPEGAVVAGLTILAVAVRDTWPGTWQMRIHRASWLSLPVLATLVQPAINVLASGSASSTGMQSKSHLYNAGSPFEQRVSDVVEFFGRIWAELLTGRSPEQGIYFSAVVSAAALLVFLLGLSGLTRSRRITVPLLMAAWVLALSAAVATLDTAFWQFKRYQLPIMALFFPAATWGVVAVSGWGALRRYMNLVRWTLAVIVFSTALVSLEGFARNYIGNVAVVRDQQVAMAGWVRDNLPEDARVGVHDVGLVRYFGDRALYDVVGLTTPGPSVSWRQGPGTVFEHMASSQYRPGYFAIYPDVQGLRYLVDAGVFGPKLAEFPVNLPKNTVASAADYQAVYEADWSGTREHETVSQTATLDYLAQVDNLRLVDQVDVSHLEDEAAHDYSWWQNEQPDGFISEVYRHHYHACGLGHDEDCWATDGGRILTGGEEFTVTTVPGDDVLLVTRVHGRASAPLRIIWGGGSASVTVVQPQLPGRWLEIVSLLPGETISAEQTRIRIEVDGGPEQSTVYLPYYHWVYQGEFVPQLPEMGQAVATFENQGRIELHQFSIAQTPDQIRVDLTWSEASHVAAGDSIVFVHLYNSDNNDTEPVAQVIERPANGVLPPENWLPGIVRDSHTLMLPGDLPVGRYQVAIGLFDALSGERYTVSSSHLPFDDRLFIGEISIEE